RGHARRFSDAKRRNQRARRVACAVEDITRPLPGRGGGSAKPRATAACAATERRLASTRAAACAGTASGQRRSGFTRALALAGARAGARAGRSAAALAPRKDRMEKDGRKFAFALIGLVAASGFAGAMVRPMVERWRARRAHVPTGGELALKLE